MKKRQISNLRVVCRQQFDDREENPFCQMHHLPHERVGNALRDEVDEWEASCPVFIDAPTGLGKTSFVYETLLPRVTEQQKNILFLSNRVALANQQKLYVMGAIESPLKDLLTEKGIQEQTLFGSVGVLTYHRLPGFLNDRANTAWINDLAYVICDECHFFTSDSSFNYNVDWILKIITSKFCSAIRIYMTATPLGCN